MKKIILTFILALAVSAPVSAQTAKAKPVATAAKSQISAQSVIDNYLAALGGKAKLEAIKSTTIENTMSVQGMELTMITKKMGNKFKSTQSVMGQEMSQTFDGEKGVINQMGQKTDIPADKIPDLKKSTTIEALAYQASNFTSVTSEQIDGRSCNVLNSDKGKFFFDTNTGLLYKSETEQGTAFVKSYMTVEGIKFPELIEAEGGGQKVSIKTVKVTLNSGVTDADFKI
ncbi:hypothetical protein [Chryseobacterium sp.]|uniref:hypothetical protein n=1 Tax=Chryseobacterium sp. TaxID=1871047 RepID=UPI00289E9C7A|nr:hypothetical protein [Chryseobacterium sp.]